MIWILNRRNSFKTISVTKLELVEEQNRKKRKGKNDVEVIEDEDDQ